LGLEYKKRTINLSNDFLKPISEEEAEYSSNCYLMSLLTVFVGVPLPIINLIASIIFYIGFKKSSYYVRWHCTQMLLSQFVLFFINSYSFWWTVSIIFTQETISKKYFYYMGFVIVFNIYELIMNIYTAIKTRKGIHVEWLIFGRLTHLICVKNNN
jgi:hypothetical protein